MISFLSRIFTWFEKRVAPFPDPQPVKPPSTLARFILHYLQPFRSLILTSCILGAVIAVIEVSLFGVLGRIVDWLAQANKETFWQDYSVWLGGIGLLLLVLLPALKLLRETVTHQGIIGNFAMRNRWQIHRYLLRQSMSFFQDDLSGRVAAKMMQTSLSVRDVVLDVTEVLLYVAVYFTAAIILFALSDIRLTAPMILWLIGYLCALKYFIPRLQKISMEQANHRSQVAGRVVDSYTNINLVKMFAHTEFEDSLVRQDMTDFLENVYEQMRLTNLLNFIIILLNYALLFCVMGLALWLWTLDFVTMGAIAFSTGLVLRLHGMSQWVMWETWTLFENIGVVQDGMEIISQDQAVVDVETAQELKVTQGSISFNNIRFNYGKVRKNIERGIIEDLSLSIKPGERIGLVGRSGAGKSTLVNLLLRFYDLEGGEISIDGQDISHVLQDSLRANIAVVSQDTGLMHRSVMDNIRYGRPSATREEVMAAAQRAEAKEFIDELEDFKGRSGFDAHVGERGVKLSGGQRQRIAIARVLLKDAPVLILDEATSALDSEVEAAIQENLYNLMKSKTVIAIAHRLSTIAAMDRLIIMDDGRIIEQGTHDELIAKGGLYASLWSRQSGGFLV